MVFLLTERAQRRRCVRRVLDVALACLLLAQMGYQLMPEDLHAVLGAALVIVAGAHLAINGAWLRSLGRGRMTAARAAFAVMACASLLLMPSLALSGLVLSGLFPALQPFDTAARAAHLSSSYLALLVFPFHAGMHAAPFLRASGASRAGKRSPVRIVGLVIWAVIALAGVCEFASLHLWDYITLRAPFVLPAEAPLPIYLAQHGVVAALSALLGAIAMHALKARKTC
ncbi:hypothetical protein [Thermophilibacter provencensis]|uniref:hypothetical protein n=1 Tax=Thermophilibacter provencensis TaxID=1852386 RepID=UPI00094ADB36|nr:hypothetical protein [Thermophilibacter provencensis]